MMEAGILIDVIDDGTTLRHDVACILLECHRDRGLHDLFHPGTTQADMNKLSEVVARRLAPMIGGRYVPKRDERAARDKAVFQRFNGRNHQELMREFGISRRLLYSILARKRGF